MSFLPHVDEASLAALQNRLKSQSSLSIEFLVLLSGSTFIATFGLLQNSPAVIIGAMIIAPLMRPLLGFSLAILMGDVKLLVRAGISISVGTLVAIGIAASISSVFISLEFTPEVLSRTHPTLLDLGVAIFAGAVGAFCHTDEKLVDSLAGVAIAVALVPPLSVVGIGTAHGDMAVWSGALLLYATNLVGISLAGSLVFLLKGFTPLKQAKKGLAISFFISLLLVIPLGLSMRELIVENQVSTRVKSVLKEKTFTFKNMQLTDVKVKGFGTPLVVFATVISPDKLISSHQVNLVQSFLSREIGVPIEFHLRIIQARDVSAVEVDQYYTKLEVSPSAPVREELMQSDTSRPTTVPDTSKRQDSPSGTMSEELMQSDTNQPTTAPDTSKRQDSPTGSVREDLLQSDTTRPTTVPDTSKRQDSPSEP